MATNLSDEHTDRMRREAGDFISQNLENAGVGWPTLPRSPKSASLAGNSAGLRAGLRVLVVGDLVLELPIEVPASRQQLLASLRAGAREKDLRGRPSEPTVGGFVARAGRAAAALGAQVSVCATVPVPMPARFERFLDECAIDRRYMTGLPVPCPVTILFRCQDGQVVVRRHRPLPITDPSPPLTAGWGFDAILIDPRRLKNGRAVLRSTSRCLGRGTEHLTVALRLNGRAGRDEVSLTNDSRLWAFFRQRDARLFAKRTGKHFRTSEAALARWLHDHRRIARVVLLRGARGAVLMNGLPRPYRVQTCPLAPAKTPGAGDTLVAVTAISSALGADDKTSVRRGVTAATGHVAGLPLPTSLEELDVA